MFPLVVCGEPFPRFYKELFGCPFLSCFTFRSYVGAAFHLSCCLASLQVLPEGTDVHRNYWRLKTWTAMLVCPVLVLWHYFSSNSSIGVLYLTWGKQCRCQVWMIEAYWFVWQTAYKRPSTINLGSKNTLNFSVSVHNRESKKEAPPKHLTTTQNEMHC